MAEVDAVVPDAGPDAGVTCPSEATHRGGAMRCQGYTCVQED